MRPRHFAWLATVTTLGATVLSGSVSPASGDQIRTETSLGGFSVSTNAAPFKMLVDDPTNPIPRPQDGPIVEADPAYSEADLDAGPTSRGIGAVLWPGGLLGEGLTQVAPGAPQWPLKAEARYPDQPYVATEQDHGAFMKGVAEGLDVLGTAKMNPQDIPKALELGTAASTSTATVKDGVAIGTSVSHVSDVSLLGGVIQVGSVATTLRVTSDGKSPTSSGSTVVSGLTINGVGYVVDDHGARPVNAPVKQGSGPLPSNAADPAKQLGITIGGISQDHTTDTDSATRDAKGLRITVDTIVLRKFLNSTTPTPLTSALYSIFGQVPSVQKQDLQGYLFYSMAMTPKITFILGAGQGSSAATLPISFQLGCPPLCPPVPNSIPGAPGGAVGAPGGGAPVTGGTLPMAGSGGTTDAGGAPPSVAGPGSPSTVAAGDTQKSPFGGIPAGLLLLVTALSATAGWGLLRLRGSAFLADALTAPCGDGASPTLPDLRGA